MKIRTKSSSVVFYCTQLVLFYFKKKKKEKKREKTHIDDSDTDDYYPRPSSISFTVWHLIDHDHEISVPFLHSRYNSPVRKDHAGGDAVLLSFPSPRLEAGGRLQTLTCRPKYKGGIGQMIRYAALRLDKCSTCTPTHTCAHKQIVYKFREHKSNRDAVRCWNARSLLLFILLCVK